MNNESIIKELKQSTFKINSCLSGISKNYFKIAAELYDIKSKFYIEQTKYKGYNNISDFAESEFSFDKTKTYNLIAIHEKFFLNRSNSPYDIYKLSQLIEMLSMTDEQLLLCTPDLKVMELRVLKNDFSRNREKESIENTELTKINNVIDGVFPDKKEEPEEPKVTTIIVTELPRPEPKENKTITIDVKSSAAESSQNNSFVQKDSFQEMYENEHHKNTELQLEIAGLKNKVRLYEESIKDFKNSYRYFNDELFEVVSTLYNEKLQKFYTEFEDFVLNNKLPKKVNFFKNVV